MMEPGRYQKGASLWMVMLFVIVLGFAAVFGLKLIPIYLEWWKVEKAVSGALQPGVGAQSIKEINIAIVRRLDIDEVRRMTNANLAEYMTITKKGNTVTVDINYDAVEPLFGNLSVLAHFEKSLTGQ
jgi:hypothetical protein